MSIRCTAAVALAEQHPFVIDCQRTWYSLLRNKRRNQCQRRTGILHPSRRYSKETIDQRQ